MGIHIEWDGSISSMWPNHAKVIKATDPTVTLMKGTNLNRLRDFWLYDIPDKWKEHMQLSQKLLDIKFDRKKNTEIMNLFFMLKIYMINAASWNELKLFGG